MSSDLLVATGIEVTYGGGPSLLGRLPGVRVLHGIDIRIGRGETVGIVGESGSGKTTLGRALLRLVDVSSGQITFDGRDITHMPDREMRPLRRRMQMIFQDPMASLNPRHSIRRILSEPLFLHGIAANRDAAEKLVRQMLDGSHSPQPCWSAIPMNSRADNGSGSALPGLPSCGRNSFWRTRLSRASMYRPRRRFSIC